jgi:hypothetical protein
VVVLGLASVALITAFGTSITASAEHRNLANYNIVLTSATQTAISEIQQQQALFETCPPIPSPATVATAASNAAFYQSQNATGQPLYLSVPSTFTVTYSSVEFWNGTSFTPTCVVNTAQAQLITITELDRANGDTYTNTFVVDYPVSTSVPSGSGTAASLYFLVDPASGTAANPTLVTPAGSALGTQPVVEVLDSQGNPVSSDLSPVILSITSGTGATGATLSGCSGNEILGVITFSGCSISTAGVGYTLTATDGTGSTGAQQLTTVSTPSFNIGASSGSLVFTNQPVAQASGSSFATPMAEVSVQGQPTWTGTITITPSGGLLQNCPNTTTIGGAVSFTTTTGSISLTGCTFEGGEYYNAYSGQFLPTPYTLTATATNLSPVTSNDFRVTGSGPVSKLIYTLEPTGAAGSLPATFPSSFAVTAEDAFGNVVTAPSPAITVGLTVSSGTWNGSTVTNETLTNCPGTFNLGVFTYSNCQASAYADALTITAADTVSGNHVTSALSTAFNITGAASQLVFTTEPVAGASGSTFTTEPVVTFEDSAGNVVTSATSQIGLALASNGSTGGTLSFCSGLTPFEGVVSVQGCTFAGIVGESPPYALTATSTGLTSATSTTFVPATYGAATKLVFTTQPVAGAAGAIFSTEPVIKVEDSAGNVVTSSQTTITLQASGGTLTPCSGLTAVEGVINVATCTFGGSDTTGSNYTLTASAVGLTSATSNAFTPSGPGAPAQVTLTGCPTTIGTNETCTAVATIKDAFNNVDTGDNTDTVTFALAPGSGTGAVTGLRGITSSGGVASDLLTGMTSGTVLIDAAVDSFTSNSLLVTVNGPLAVSTASLPGGDVGSAYSKTLAASGGTGTYSTWALSAGTLPGGLTLNTSTGVISGTPTTAGTATGLKFTVTDSFGATALSGSLSIVISPTLTVSTSSLPGGDVGSAYTKTLTAGGGSGTYSTWALSAGTLPGGLSLNTSSGVISGTPTTAGTATGLTFTVTDSNNGTAVSASLSIVISPTLTVSTPSLPGGDVGSAYSKTLTAGGGSGTYSTWALSSGTLPGGLTLNTSSGVISGTPTTAGTTNGLLFKVTDTNNDTALSASLSIVIGPTLTVSTPSLPGGDVGSAYTKTLAAGGGSGTYSTWTLSSGTLPGGLTLNTSSGVISGTPTTAGTATGLTFTVTDSNNDTAVSGSLSIVISPTLTVTTTSPLPLGAVGSAYTTTLAHSGGTGTYTWALSSGTLPTGLTLAPSTGIISGTPTAAGTATGLTFTVTDSNNDTALSASLSITINPILTVTTASPLHGGDVGATYTTTLAAGGGSGTYTTWALSAGTLPGGLTLNTSTGVISGTPTTAGTVTGLTFRVTDSFGATASSGSLSIVISPALSVSTSSLPGGDASSPYSTTLAHSGGTGTYTWALNSGTLPTGLTLAPSTGIISGTPTAAGTALTFTVTDSNTDTAVSGSLSIVISPALSVSTSSLPGGDASSPYSTTLAHSGGTGTYTWALNSGTLPTGLTLAPSTGIISGTPTAAGTALTFTVTDSNTDTAVSVSLSIVISPALSVSTSSLPGGDASSPYSTTLAHSGGTGTYTWALNSGTLPTGLTLAPSTGIISGTPGASGSITGVTFKVTDSNNDSAVSGSL